MIIGRKSYLFPQISSGLTKDLTDDFIFLKWGRVKNHKNLQQMSYFHKTGQECFHKIKK